MIERAALGFLLASLVAVVAVRSRALTRDGGVAAVVVGTICVAAGWGWAALLAVFFVTSSALSRVREATRARLEKAPPELRRRIMQMLMDEEAAREPE